MTSATPEPSLPAGGGVVRAPRAPAAVDTVFRRRTVAWLAGLTAASLAAALVFAAFAGQMRAGDSPQADAFSRSSIGYRALCELLDASGVHVVVSRFRSAHKAGPRAPLLLAEPTQIFRVRPPADEAEGDTQDDAGDPTYALSRFQGLADVMADAAARGAPVVVVLPKWIGEPDHAREGWLGGLELRPLQDADDALGAALGGVDARSLPRGCVVAGARGPLRFRSALPGGELATLDGAQLVTGCDLEPLVWSDAGVLVGQVPDRAVVVVSDPDLLNTRGLARGDNAVIAHRLFVDRLGAESVVVDEVLHGFWHPPSIWTELLTLPLLPITLHALALLALAVAAAMVRFGKPKEAPPRVPPGKRALVESTAALLDGGGHHAESLRRYLRMTLRHTAAAVGLPPAATTDPLPALASLARARGVRGDVVAIARDIDALAGPTPDAPPARPGPRSHPRAAAHALALAAALDQWRKEMTHGFR